MPMKWDFLMHQLARAMLQVGGVSDIFLREQAPSTRIDSGDLPSENFFWIVRRKGASRIRV
jgi:hypothetical protein